MKRVYVNDATGLVEATWAGGDNQFQSRPGCTAVAVPEASQDDYSGMRWLGGTTFERASVPLRLIAVDAFFDLFTRRQRVAIRRKARGDAAASPPVPADDDIADLVHQLDIKAATSGTVNLDSPKLSAGLDLLIARGVINAADKAQILQGQPPA